MVNDLSTLLRESAAHPPPDHGAVSDLAEVVRLGRSRVRRRRIVAVSGAVASVAAVTVAGALLTGGTGGSASPQPADQLAPVGPVVHPADAEPGVAGRDYTVVTSYTAEDPDRANGQHLEGITPDGQVLFRDGPHGPDDHNRWALLDPDTGAKEWLTDHPSIELDRAIALEESRLVFLSGRGKNLVVVFHDRDSGGWSAPIETPVKAWTVMQTEAGPDDRLWYTVQGDGGGTSARLWSVGLSEPGAPRDEGVDVGEFDITGDELVYTASTNEPNDRITVRDLTTGAERSFDPESGDRCTQLSMQRAGNHVVLGQYCGTTNGGESPVRDDRIQVIDLDGNPVVTVQGHGVTAGAVSDDGFVVINYGSFDDRDGATYTWSFADQELRRVADATSTFSSSWLSPEKGPAGSDVSGVLMWPEGVDDMRGEREVVARLP